MDLSKITDMADRQEALRLLNAVNDAAQRTWDTEGPEYDAACEEHMKAEEIYQESPLPALLLIGDVAVLCALSNVPVWEDDEYLEDFATGEVILRCFSGLPPRADDEAEHVPEEVVEALA